MWMLPSRGSGSTLLVVSGARPGAGERLLPERIVRHIVLGPVEDLFAVVAGIQPRSGIDRLPVEVVAADDGLAQEHRIGDDGDVGEVVTVPHEELREGGLIALRHAVAAAKGAALHVRGANHKAGPHELACREPSEGAWSPCRRGGTPGHPSNPLSFGRPSPA